MKAPILPFSLAALLVAGAGLGLSQSATPPAASAPTPPKTQATPAPATTGAATGAAAKPIPVTPPAPSRTVPPVAALPAPTVPRIENFRIIYERNMFNAHRIGLTPRSSREGRDASGDIVTLVGTLLDEKRAVAFFDSADPRYRRVLKEGNRLPSGHILKKVEQDGIIIARDTASAKVQVTQRLHRMENGDWEILQPETGSALTTGTTTASDPTKPTTPGALPVIPPNASDALRRLMELRQKQLKE